MNLEQKIVFSIKTAFDSNHLSLIITSLLKRSAALPGVFVGIWGWLCIRAPKLAWCEWGRSSFPSEVVWSWPQNQLPSLPCLYLWGFHLCDARWLWGRTQRPVPSHRPERSGTPPSYYKDGGAVLTLANQSPLTVDKEETGRGGWGAFDGLWRVHFQTYYSLERLGGFPSHTKARPSLISLP